MIKFKKSPLHTGLDIGSSHIRLIQLSEGPEAFLLTNFCIIRISGKTEAKKKALSEIARRLSSKEVNIAISGPGVVVRYIELPKMSDEELKSSMKFEAEKYIPFNIKDVIVDSQALEKTDRGRMRVLLAAAKKDVVTERIDLVEKAGLSVNLVDCDSFALTNAFLLNFPDIEEHGSSALINIGERSTIINIIKGKSAYFTRELQIGGWDFTKAVSEKLNMGIEDASGLKENPQGRFAELTEIAKPIIIEIMEEAKLSLNYYENQTGLTVDKIYLSGELSSFPGLTDVFTESMGIECRLWDTTRRLNIDKDIDTEKLNKAKGQLPIALGLAMRR